MQLLLPNFFLFLANRHVVPLQGRSAGDDDDTSLMFKGTNLTDSSRLAQRRITTRTNIEKATRTTLIIKILIDFFNKRKKKSLKYH